MLRSPLPSVAAKRMSRSVTAQNTPPTRIRKARCLRHISARSSSHWRLRSGGDLSPNPSHFWRGEQDKLVRERGLEPLRACAHKVLSLARLPFRHSRERGQEYTV